MKQHSRQSVEETGNLTMWGDVNLADEIPLLDPEGVFITIEGDEGDLVVVPFGAPANHEGIKTYFWQGENPKLVREIINSNENTATGVKWSK